MHESHRRWMAADVYEIDHCTAFGPCSARGITPSNLLLCGEQLVCGDLTVIDSAAGTFTGLAWLMAEQGSELS